MDRHINWDTMFKTFKGNLIIINPPNAMGEKLIPDGLMWHFRLGNPELPTVNISNEVFEFTKDEILFSTDQINRYGDRLRLDPFDTKFYDEIKYVLHKHYRRGKPIYEIKIDNYTLTINLTWWDKFKLNVIHNRYWLFNEQKWFVTFIISVIGLLLAIVALLVGD